jgi:hypothetical protein
MIFVSAPPETSRNLTYKYLTKFIICKFVSLLITHLYAMAPGIIANTYDEQSSALHHKANGNKALNASKAVSVREDYEGDYRFAPIEEAQVSRAMIKRCAFNCLAHQCK